MDSFIILEELSSSPLDSTMPLPFSDGQEKPSGAPIDSQHDSSGGAIVWACVVV
ncbi:hypothetical protein FA95DRAFT_1552556 [Auriscalpium vulgare]|uniref:Uncharacterized protein n=1 Tax=Auriscalpium vulgare TaxID=40419 RepID=A0ACB8SBC8_9AGAM|nr:hypothetical protein FA95DRAFT_1552556 [Auriscalpium vulgare]